MIHFKVVRASHILLCAAAIILALVVGAIVLNLFLAPESQESNAQADFVQVQMDSEAETQTVFASIDSVYPVLELDPSTDEPVTVEVLTNPSPLSVLIYHTHTHEAYEQTSDAQYEAIEAWRTIDPAHSVVRVGEELADLLSDCGFNVVHDTTDHEQNDLATAYVRSLDTLKSYDHKFDLYIDLHRDAYMENMLETPVFNGDQKLARIMLLVGNGEGFREKPYYDENLAFAEELTDRINIIKPGLCKDVLVKDGRYNQHIGVFSILVEVGHNKNTLREALASLPFLAQGIKDIMIGNPDEELAGILAATHASE